MKTKGRRKSSNVEVRESEKINNLVTPEQWYTDKEPFVKRRELDVTSRRSEHLRDKRRVKDQPRTEADKMVQEIYTNFPDLSKAGKTREETAKPTRFRKSK